MFYALTVNNGIITGVHSSVEQIKQGHFKRSPKFAEDIVVPIESGEYAAGHNVKEYSKGKLRPLVDRVKEGFAEVPAGYELIEGELVKKDVASEGTPELLSTRLEAIEAEIANIYSIFDMMAGLDGNAEFAKEYKKLRKQKGGE